MAEEMVEKEAVAGSRNGQPDILSSMTRLTLAIVDAKGAPLLLHDDATCAILFYFPFF